MLSNGERLVISLPFLEHRMVLILKYTELNEFSTSSCQLIKITVHVYQYKVTQKCVSSFQMSLYCIS